MKKLVAVFTCMVVCAAVSAVAADGKALYDKECGKCHGVDGKGQTVMGKKMKAKDYSDAKVQAAVTDEAMTKAIKDGYKDADGKEVMKPSKLTDEEIKAIAAHMRSLKK